MSVLSDMRKTYTEGELEAEQDDPVSLFTQWFNEAVRRKVPEPNAMTLCTVGPNNRPSSRVVLIKSYDSKGIVWFTNYESRKGQELAANPFAALQFHWVEMERVVRIEGKVSKIDPVESDAYYHSRPLDSRLGAWASPQSNVLSSRAELVANVAKVTAQKGLNPSRPPFWGGYRLEPDQWQFWQGRPSRLHDRFRYSLQTDGKWLKERLAP